MSTCSCSIFLWVINQAIIAFAIVIQLHFTYFSSIIFNGPSLSVSQKIHNILNVKPLVSTSQTYLKPKINFKTLYHIPISMETTIRRNKTKDTFVFFLLILISIFYSLPPIQMCVYVCIYGINSHIIVLYIFLILSLMYVCIYIILIVISCLSLSKIMYQLE